MWIIFQIPNNLITVAVVTVLNRIPGKCNVWTKYIHYHSLSPHCPFFGIYPKNYCTLFEHKLLRDGVDGFPLWLKLLWHSI